MRQGGVHGDASSTSQIAERMGASSTSQITERMGASASSQIAVRMGMSVDCTQKHRRHLIDAGVIQSAGRRKVAFAVPYLKEFLREELGE